MESHNYPQRYDDVQQGIVRLREAAPGPMRAFSQLHREALADGALPRSTKELIALGIAIAARCDGCIAFHVHDALSAGARPVEVTEAIGVAVLMGGGPSAVYGAEAFAALEQFEALPAAVTG